MFALVSQLLPAQLEILIRRLRLPQSFLSASSTPSVIRAGEILQLIGQRGDEGIAQLRRCLDELHRANTASDPAVRLLCGVPPLPSLIIGREQVKDTLRARLRAEAEGQALTVVRGWPGVGKSTVAAALAHDLALADHFPDGVLWVSLGELPNVLAGLNNWCHWLGDPSGTHAGSIPDASSRLALLLRARRMLLIIDDAWQTESALPFRVGGRDCATLVTTRDSAVARALVARPGDVYLLRELDEEQAYVLLAHLAPSVVAAHAVECRELVRELEGLPLALQVAGRLLEAEAGLGWGVASLLQDIRQGARLLEATAPADRIDQVLQTTPTVAALIQQSTSRLDPQAQACFAYLGAFAPKPATFDLEAMAAVWEMDDPRPMVRQLEARGLLEPIPGGRFQMHAVLAMYARTMLGG